MRHSLRALEQSGSRQNQTRASPQFLGKQPRSRWNLSESECSSEKQPGTSGESGQSVSRAHKWTNKQARPFNDDHNPLKSFWTKSRELQNTKAEAGFQTKPSLQAREQWAQVALWGTSSWCSPALKLSGLLLCNPYGPPKGWPWNKGWLGTLSPKGFIQEKEKTAIWDAQTWWATRTKMEEVLYEGEQEA